MRIHAAIITFIAGFCCQQALAAEPVRLTGEQTHMGTTFRIVAYATNEQIGHAAIDRAFARIGELDQKLSDYQSDSELMRLCSTAPHSSPVEVSHDVWRVLKQSRAVSQASDGAFDVSVGQLTKLWRRARRQRVLPPAELLEPARATVGYEHIVVDPSHPRIQVNQPNLRIDLGGIAKGFASDEAMRILRSAGITQALVDAGGGMTIGAPPPGKLGWRIAVASIVENQPPSQFLTLSECAVSTSGDLWQFVEVDGVRYSHILDPRTGKGLTERIAVTVVADDGATSDALATAVCVLGADRGMELVKEFRAKALIATMQDAAVKQTISPELQPLLNGAESGAD